MTQEKIDQINAFARRIKNGETLSPEELRLRDALRREYIDSVKQNLNAQLDHTVVQYPDGSKKPLERKKKPETK